MRPPPSIPYYGRTVVPVYASKQLTRRGWPHLLCSPVKLAASGPTFCWVHLVHLENVPAAGNV